MSKINDEKRAEALQDWLKTKNTTQKIDLHSLLKKMKMQKIYPKSSDKPSKQ
jgi:hypothetical protein